jgi:hypothetical protein
MAVAAEGIAEAEDVKTSFFEWGGVFFTGTRRQLAGGLSRYCLFCKFLVVTWDFILRMV